MRTIGYQTRAFRNNRWHNKKGLALNERAFGPKEKHAVLGAEIAQKILISKKLLLGLNDADIEIICKAILFHDKPSEKARELLAEREMEVNSAKS